MKKGYFLFIEHQAVNPHLTSEDAAVIKFMLRIKLWTIS